MEVLYRKYRPRTFSEVVGQDPVKRLLRKAVSQRKIAHAYIFAGPRGTGKTTMARILAKAVNCDGPAGGEPCNKCEACQQIDAGSFLDVLEIDAASNRGIDEIRKVRDYTSYMPVHGKMKVYIIDEFHMLTKEAFNALLKTLEEPPSHVLFVLATTNLEKVPPTILSRCQIFQFRNLTEDEIYERLKHICSNEGFQSQESALRLIARRSKGGMRDAIAMLEQVATYTDGDITEAEVRDVLGLLPQEMIEKYVRALREGDADEVVHIAKEIYRSGKEYEVFLEDAIDLLLEEARKGKKGAAELASILWNLYRELRYAPDKRTIFELKSLVLVARKEVPHDHVEKIEKGKGKKREEVEKRKREGSEVSSRTLKVLEYLKDRGNMAVYVALRMSKMVEQGDRVVVEVSTPFHYELLHPYLDQLKGLYKNLTGSKVEIELKSFSEPARSEKNDVLEKLEENERDIVKKLMKLFPDRIRIEPD